jgi:tetratricopeptide (TPR) repeat protein
MREGIAYLESAAGEWLEGVDLRADERPSFEPPELSHGLLERLGAPAVASDEAHDGNETGAEARDSDDDFAPEDFSPDDAFTQGHAALQAQQYDEAVRLFQEVIDHEPYDGEAYVQLAIANSFLNRPMEAVVAAGKAIEINEDDAEAFQVRGSGYMALGRWHDAVDDYTRSLAIDRAEKRKDRFASTAHRLGQARARLGRYKEAIRDFSIAISEIPTWDTPYESRAEAYEQLGETTKAAADRAEFERRREAL